MSSIEAKLQFREKAETLATPPKVHCLACDQREVCCSDRHMDRSFSCMLGARFNPQLPPPQEYEPTCRCVHVTLQPFAHICLPSHDTGISFWGGATFLLVPQDELPGQEAAVDGGKLSTPRVEVIVALPQMPTLVHLPNDLPSTILHQNGAVDKVEGPPHSENDLGTCSSRNTVHVTRKMQ